MKRLISIAIMTMLLSQNSTAQTGSEFSTQPTSMKQHTVRHAKVPKIKLFRSNPHRIYIDDSDEIVVDDEGLMSPYRRQDLFKIVEFDDVSDRVRWRLFLARQLAVLRHQVKL